MRRGRARRLTPYRELDTDGGTDLIELTAYLQENVPRNEATLLYANETTVLLQLRVGGIYNQNILACSLWVFRALK